VYPLFQAVLIPPMFLTVSHQRHIALTRDQSTWDFLWTKFNSNRALSEYCVPIYSSVTYAIFLAVLRVVKQHCWKK